MTTKAPKLRAKDDPEKMRVYRLRAKLKRWTKEREEFQDELDRKRTSLSFGGIWMGAGSLEYPRARIRDLTAQIKELEAVEDLRTDEEKRGFKRKTYERRKQPELRGITDEALDEHYRRERRLGRGMEKTQEQYAIDMATPGSRIRATMYDEARDTLDRLYEHADLAARSAKLAISRKRDSNYALTSDDKAFLKEWEEWLAKLNSLDAQFPECGKQLCPPFRKSKEQQRADEDNER